VSRLAARLLPENIWVAVEGTTSRRILVDPADLQQALLNLLLNARDAMPSGGNVVMQLEDANAADGSHQVIIHVRDSGTGIDPAVLPRIFDPFFTTKERGQGTGLGLPMVKAFMEEAGGTIDLSSSPGKGTTISLRFPETRLPAPASGEPTPALAANGARRVLLIEDREDLRELMERALIHGGYEVTACASCDEALVELDANRRFDLLVTDGVGSRTPLATVINRLRSADASLPVLLCSGHADQELLRGEFAALRVELLRKPFTGTELLVRLGELRRTKN
jgi:CheY-like chemotaxis protein